MGNIFNLFLMMLLHLDRYKKTYSELIKKIFLYIFFFISINGKDSLAIIVIDWNRGDIDEFMKGYLKSEKLVFFKSNPKVDVQLFR